MAGYQKPEFVLLDQLKKDGWSMHDMGEYESRLGEIATWCRQTLGNMLMIYDADIIDCCWHGTTLALPTADEPDRSLCVFAFKNEADYTMLKLKFG